MSIGSRVSDTIEKLEAGDPESALFQLCAAIEATATEEMGIAGKRSYKDFVHEHLGLITKVAFGNLTVLNLSFKYHHPKVNVNSDGNAPFQEIIYHVVRCGFYHKAKLPPDLQFTSDSSISVEIDGTILFPSSLIRGLLIAVVVSPANRTETLKKEAVLNVKDFSIPMSKLWGRRAELIWLLDAVDEMNRLNNAKAAT